jgi:hypothetical protein
VKRPVRALCDLFDVHPSGYYAWLKKPRSNRAVANERLTGLIKQFWLESGGVYGYRKIFSDLRENDDGSLDIVIQYDPPEKNTENWLPTTKGIFALTMRFYLPKQSVLDGSWKLPPLVRQE